MIGCVLAVIVGNANATTTYQDVIDEITNSQKESVYNLDLNAPYSKDKSGIKEIIDPETGDVSVICDLFSLKGRAGQNTINLSISYRNSIAKAMEENAENNNGVYTNLLAEKTSFQKSQSFFGIGWSLYFPYVEKQDEYNKTNLYVHMADGTAYKQDDSENGLADYDLTNVGFYDININRNGILCKYMLRYADGTIYYFDEDGYLCEKTDRFNNSVQYIWTTVNEVRVIQYISDNCGQTVRFDYEDNTVYVRFENQVYRLQKTPNADDVDELTSITDPIGRITRFEYYRADLEFNFFNGTIQSQALTNPYYLIRRVNYPIGVETVYEYVRGRKWLYEKENGYLDYVRVAKRYDTDQKSISDQMRYVYYNEPDGYPNYKPDNIPTTYFYSTSEMDIDGGGTAYYYDWRHYQYKTEIWADGRRVSEEIKEFDSLTGMPITFIGNTYNKNGNKTTVYNRTKFDSRANIIEEDKYSENEVPGEHIHTYRYSEGYNICIYESYYKDKDTLAELVRTLNSEGTAIGGETTLCNGRKIKQDSYKYDRYGNVIQSVQQTDKNAFLTTEYEYSGEYNQKYPTKITARNIQNADGEGDSYTVEYKYDKYGNVVLQTDNDKNVISYEYDILNRKIKETLEDGKAREYKYNDNLNTINTIDAAGARLLYSYDSYGRLVSVIDEIANIPLTTRSYDAKGRLIKETDANNNSQSYEYDGLDRYVKVEVRDAEGKILSRRTVEYDEAYASADGNCLKLSISDGAGFDIRKTEYLFDYENRVTRKTQNSENEDRTMLYSYDFMGNNISQIDFAGRETLMYYDIFGNCTSVIRPDGIEESYEYNYLGNQTKATNGMGESVFAEYDALGRKIKDIIPNGEEESEFKTYYDYRGNVIKTVDAKGFKTENSYNERGFMISQRQYSTAAEGIETEYEYDGEGRLIQTSYGAIGKEKERHVYKNVLDHLGRITQSIDNLGNIGYTEYDGNGNIIRKTDRNGIVTTMEYDGLNKVIAETNSKNGTKEYEYNDFGEILSATDGINRICYTYNSFGEVTNVKDNYSDESFSYDISGNLTEYKKTDLEIGEILQSYSYDILNRLTEVITPVGNEMLTYDNANRVITKTNTGTGIEKTYSYNPNGTVRTIKTIQNGKLTYSEYYEYDKNLNRIYADENGDITEYTYDGMSRLIEVTKNNTKTTSYEFDGYNNIIKEYELFGGITNTKIYQYDANNRLILKDDNREIEQYTYDNEGNMTEKAMGIGSQMTKSYYSYDGYNRLSEFVSDTDIAQYTYDVTGMRKTKTVNGETTRFVYQGGDIIGEVKAEKSYKYYRGTDLIGSVSGNEYQYYRTNAHGDITAILDIKGEVIQDYSYDAYGNKDSISINPEGTNSILYRWKQEINTTYNPFGYCGEYQDAETGFIYLRNRYYDPTIARFITEDPIMDGLNWYAYCNGNPVTFVDPWGLFDYDTKLSKGSTGDDVKVLQNELKWLGYYNGEIDGSFGPATLSAVNKYKNDAGLWNFDQYEGVVGKTTWESLGLIYRTQIDINAEVTIRTIDCKQYFDVTTRFNKVIDYAAKLARNNKLDAEWFISMVNNGCDWDIKLEKPWKKTMKISYPGGKYTPVICYGMKLSPADLGNILYGYAGSAAAFTPTVLYGAGGMVQQGGTGVKEFINAFIDGAPNWGDSEEDHFAIRLGIAMYTGEMTY